MRRALQATCGSCRPLPRGSVDPEIEKRGHVILSSDNARYLGNSLWRRATASKVLMAIIG